MFKILEILSQNTATIIVTLLITGFLAYMFMRLFQREIKAYLKKKFKLYDEFEMVTFARDIAHKQKGNTFMFNLSDIYKEFENYKKSKK